MERGAGLSNGDGKLPMSMSRGANDFFKHLNCYQIMFFSKDDAKSRQGVFALPTFGYGQIIWGIKKALSARIMVIG